MTFFPTCIYKIANNLKRLSYWIDTFFPVPSNEEGMKMLHMEQMAVEQNANYISRQIKSCRNLNHTYTCMTMILNFKRNHNETTQVRSWIDSLTLEVHNKQIQILNDN